MIYGSKYGTTKEICEKIASNLNHVQTITPAVFNEVKDDPDLVIIASAIYAEQLHPEILKFVNDQERWLKSKEIAVLGVCLGGQRGIQYLNPIKNQLEPAVIWTGMTKGRLTLAKLSAQDYTLMKNFTEKVGMPFIDRDFVDEADIQKIIHEIKEIIQKY